MKFKLSDLLLGEGDKKYTAYITNKSGERVPIEYDDEQELRDIVDNLSDNDDVEDITTGDGRDLKESINTLAKDAVIEYLRLHEGNTIPTSTEILLGKFPTLRNQIVKLFTKEYDKFIDRIEWVAPRPSTFKVKFRNGADMMLRWSKQGFAATIRGKRYMLDTVSDVQKALEMIAITLATDPITAPNETPDSKQGDQGGEGGPSLDSFTGGDTGGLGADFDTGEGGDIGFGNFEDDQDEEPIDIPEPDQ